MPHRWRIGLLLLAAMACSVCANSPWYRYVYQEYHQEPTGHQQRDHPQHRQCDHRQHHQERDPPRQEEEHRPGNGRGEYGGYDDDGNGCACLLYAERTLVSRSEDKSSWHSCDGWGLQRCRQYCDALLQDEDARFRILQNACDTLGREIITPLYRRHQVCGQYGPYEDVLLPEDLCCRRGRPSDSC